VFIALFKIGNQMEVATIVAGTIWPLLLNTLDGARTVDPVQLEMARAFRLSGWQRLWCLILPVFWSTLVLLGMLGYLLNAILYGIERVTLAWHRGARQLPG